MNIDAFRHAIERIDAARYLGSGYYGRWLLALEDRLVEAGALARGELDARLGALRSGAAPPAAAPWRRPAGVAPAGPAMGYARETGRAPRFAPGARVRARNLHPAGHTRLPGYVRGRCGEVVRAHGGFVFPDAHAHGRGEQPQHLYSVRFESRELWGDDAEGPGSVYVDLFESYLESGGSPT